MERNAVTDRFVLEAPGVAAIMCGQCARHRAWYMAAGTTNDAGTPDPMAGRFFRSDEDGVDHELDTPVACHQCGHVQALPPASAVEEFLALDGETERCADCGAPASEWHAVGPCRACGSNWPEKYVLRAERSEGDAEPRVIGAFDTLPLAEAAMEQMDEAGQWPEGFDAYVTDPFGNLLWYDGEQGWEEALS